jgi:hypothetical protein
MEPTLAELIEQDAASEDSKSLRDYVLPVEDLPLHWALHSSGGAYRWFRSPNVIPIEVARRLRDQRRASGR